MPLPARPRQNGGLPSSAPTEPASRPCAVLDRKPAHIQVHAFLFRAPPAILGRGDRLYFVLFDRGGKNTVRAQTTASGMGSNGTHANPTWSLA